MRSRTAGLLAAVGCALLVFFTLEARATDAPSPPSGTSGASNGAAEDNDRVTRYRRSMSLPNDSSVRQRAHEEQGSRVQRFGIPLTHAEEADLSNRMELQSRAENLVARVAEEADGAGVWFDQTRGGKVVVDVPESADAAKFRRLASEMLPSDDVEFRRVRHNSNELRDLAEKVRQDEPQLRKRGHSLVSAGRDPIANTAVAEIVALSPEDEAALEQEYPGVDFGPGSFASTEDDRGNSPGQWKSGIRTVNATGGGCTTNFTFQNANGRFQGTAGHCHGGKVANPWGVGSVWDHNWNSNFVMTDNYLGHDSLVDAALIDVPDFLGSNILVAQAGPAGQSVGQGANVNGVTTGDPIGGQVCKGGITTGWACGQLLQVMDRLVDANGDQVGDYWLREQRGTNMAHAEGDSGAGVVSNMTFPSAGVWNARAIGVYWGDGWYSHIVHVQNRSGTTVRVTPSYVPFRVAHSSMCMGLVGSTQADAAQIEQLTCTGGSNQLWWTRPRYGDYQLVALHSAKCADIRLGGADNVPFQQHSCLVPPSTYQRFWLAAAQAGGGQFQSVTRFAGKCADVSGRSVLSGADIVQWTCVAGAAAPLGDNQRWHMY